MKKPFDEYTHHYDLWFDTKGRDIEVGVGTGRFAGFMNITANSLKLAKGRVRNLVCGYAEDLIPRAFSEIGRVLFVPRNTCIVEFYVYKGLGGHRIANSEGLLIRGDLGQSLR
jgi:hypothetical protein